MVLLAKSAAFVAYEASSAASALAPWSAVMLASRLASCAATKASVARPSRAFAILVSTSTGVSNPSTAESRELAEEGGVQGCRGDSVQEGCRYLGVHLRGSVHGRLQGVSSQGAGVCLGGLQPRDGGVSARELGGQSRVSTSRGVILAAMSRECWSTTVLRP